MTKLTVRAKLCFETAQRKWGPGWKHLTPEMREAFICRELVYMLLAQSNVENNSTAILMHTLDDIHSAFNKLNAEAQ